MISKVQPFNGFDYVYNSNPAVDTNPPYVAAKWLNLTSGEVFVCTDASAGSNIWVGSNSITRTVDIFEDSSCTMFAPLTLSQMFLDESGFASYVDAAQGNGYAFVNKNVGYVNFGSLVTGYNMVISFFVKNKSGLTFAIGSGYKDAAYRGLGVVFGNEPSEFLFGDGGGTSSTNRSSYSFSIASVDFSEWTHVCLWAEDFSTPVMYLNGVSIPLTYLSGTASATSFIGDLALGARHTVPIEGFSPSNFIVKMVRTFNRSLTQAEVTDLYNEGT